MMNTTVAEILATPSADEVAAARAELDTYTAEERLELAYVLRYLANGRAESHKDQGLGDIIHTTRAAAQRFVERRNVWALIRARRGLAQLPTSCPCCTESFHFKGSKQLALPL